MLTSKKPHTQNYTEFNSIDVILLGRQNYSDSKKIPGFLGVKGWLGVDAGRQVKRELFEGMEMIHVMTVMVVTRQSTFVQNSLCI